MLWIGCVKKYRAKDGKWIRSSRINQHVKDKAEITGHQKMTKTGTKNFRNISGRLAVLYTNFSYLTSTSLQSLLAILTSN